MISFNNPWKFSHPTRFPTENYFIRNSYVVAPFWSDNDIRKEGTVRYISIAEGGSAQGDALISQTSSFLAVRRNMDKEDLFIGIQIWMLVAQWDQVHPHPHGADDHEGISESFLEKVNSVFRTLCSYIYMYIHIIYTYIHIWKPNPFCLYM